VSAWEADRDWAAGYEPELRTILARNLIHLVSLSPANEQQDTRQATDYIVSTSIGEIAFRVRHERCNFRDVTFRYRRRRTRDAPWKGGYEVDKLINGHCRAYLYAWVRR
jgi:hypothetical protein